MSKKRIATRFFTFFSILFILSVIGYCFIFWHDIMLQDNGQNFIITTQPTFLHLLAVAFFFLLSLMGLFLFARTRLFRPESFDEMAAEVGNQWAPLWVCLFFTVFAVLLGLPALNNFQRISFQKNGNLTVISGLKETSFLVDSWKFCQFRIVRSVRAHRLFLDIYFKNESEIMATKESDRKINRESLDLPTPFYISPKTQILRIQPELTRYCKIASNVITE